jgi:4-amino-4-deoxy-L-arabinose transferase-like glycosyltransferase
LSGKTKTAAAALLLVAAGILSYSAALTESFTTDEPLHLAAGASYLATGDFRLNPEHPVLAKVWAALPLWFIPHTPFTEDLNGWAYGGVSQVAIDWLEHENDGNLMLRAPRALMVVLFIGLCVTVGWTAYRLLGPEAGLLAVALAAFDPLLLAHGHYVTTDVPVALCVSLSLLSFAAFLRRPTAATFAWAAVSLSAASLVKYSWVLALPAFILMIATAFFRSRIEKTVRRFPWLPILSFPLIVASGIWAAYGFRFDPFRQGGPAPPAEGSWRAVFERGAPPPFSPVSHDEAWESVLHDKAGNPRTGLSVNAVSIARKLHLLPEAYLYGFAHATRHAENRRAYLNGRFSETGWHIYFPVAYLVKTPVPELLLLLAGLAALAARRARIGGDPVLALGVLAFAAVYGATALSTNLNIGLRHMIPVYPALLVIASASAVWMTSRGGRIAVLLLSAWMATVAVVSCPYYLGYFNEAAGGWRNGHRWLVDSNLDWDQDFLRLFGYQKTHPSERIFFLPLGKTPRPRGLRTEPLAPDSAPGAAWPPPLAAGTYVVSATWLVGTFQPLSRSEAWQDARLQSAYEALWNRWSRRPPPGADGGEEAGNSFRVFDSFRRALLLKRLQQRPPDDRLGTSLFVFRLSEEDLERLTRPGEVAP